MREYDVIGCQRQLRIHSIIQNYTRSSLRNGFSGRLTIILSEGRTSPPAITIPIIPAFRIRFPLSSLEQPTLIQADNYPTERRGS
jgi:hypothetical protein